MYRSPIAFLLHAGHLYLCMWTSCLSTQAFCVQFLSVCYFFYTLHLKGYILYITYKWHTVCPVLSCFSELAIIFIALDVAEFKLVEVIEFTVSVFIFDTDLAAGLSFGHGFLSGGVNNLVNLLLSVVVAIRAFAFGLVVSSWMLCLPSRLHAIGLIEHHFAITCPVPWSMQTAHRFLIASTVLRRVTSCLLGGLSMAR